jgi:hypothetical protein
MNISTADICDSDFVMRSINGTMADSNKKIDYALGLQLSRSTIRTLQEAIPPLITPSINQTASFANWTAMFLTVEVKRYVSTRNPRIQLAAWIAAEFKKRQCEGWPLDILC